MPKRGTGDAAFDALSPAMVVAVKHDGGAGRCASVPEVSRRRSSSRKPHTGRVLAMQGGFDFAATDFNRATQALRQPGSTFKPFVYAAALDNGMTPATIIVDGPFCVCQGAGLGNKCFRNFADECGGGRRRCAGASSSRAT